MEGQHWAIRNEQQRDMALANVHDRQLPFQLKLMDQHSPKSGKQIRYAHSLCNALAAYRQASPEMAKKDAKAAFGVVIVCSSLITGDRSARLKSFADYTKDEMEAFITQMEQHLSEKLIPFIGCET
jgi:hypothetical protein